MTDLDWNIVFAAASALATVATAVFAGTTYLWARRTAIAANDAEMRNLELRLSDARKEFRNGQSGGNMEAYLITLELWADAVLQRLGTGRPSSWHRYELRRAQGHLAPSHGSTAWGAVVHDLPRLSALTKRCEEK